MRYESAQRFSWHARELHHEPHRSQMSCADDGLSRTKTNGLIRRRSVASQRGDMSARTQAKVLRVLEGGEVEVTGPRRDLWAMRKSGWLTPAQVLEVNRLIGAMARTFRPSRRGRLYGITVLLTPLERRRRPSWRER